MPAMSLGMAVSSLVAQNLGAGKNERVQESVYWSSLITLIITLLISLAAFFIPQLLLFPLPPIQVSLLQVPVIYIILVLPIFPWL